MKVARLIVGILTILWSLAVIAIMGSLTLLEAEVSFEDLDEILEVVAEAPLIILLGAFLLAGGIVMVACHKRAALGGCIACAALFGIGFVFSLVLGGPAYIAGISFIPLFIFSIAGVIVAAIQKGKAKEQASAQ